MHSADTVRYRIEFLIVTIYSGNQSVAFTQPPHAIGVEMQNGWFAFHPDRKFTLVCVCVFCIHNLKPHLINVALCPQRLPVWPHGRQRLHQQPHHGVSGKTVDVLLLHSLVCPRSLASRAPCSRAAKRGTSAGVRC